MIKINPFELYSLDCINFNDISEELYENNNENTIQNIFWAPNTKINDKLIKLLNNKNITDKIIDIGCGSVQLKFPPATYLLDFKEIDDDVNTVIKLDLDFDKFPYPDNFFNFVYSRHTLEDIQNPINAFNEFIRISNTGYIETPSPLIEIMKGIDAPIGNSMRGYKHHRYFVWSDLKTNTINFLPKYPIIEHITIDETILKKFTYLLNNYPVYWNNYYFWDNSRPANIVIYRNDINFQLYKDYARLLNDAINSSIEYTNIFIKYLSDL